MALLVGSLIAVGGVALVSMNGVVNLHLRPLGDLMALGAMVSWGFYSLLIDKANEKGYPSGFAVRKAFGWSLAMMLPLCVWGVTDSGYCALGGASLCCCAHGHESRFRRRISHRVDKRARGEILHCQGC